MANDNSLETQKYIQNSSNVDDSYGNKDGIKDAKDINFDLKNSIKNNLKIAIPSGMNGVNYSNYIVAKSSDIGKETIQYSPNMTIAQKLELLMEMKKNVRNQIIKLKLKTYNDFFDSNGKEKIPFVQYWKWITPLIQSSHITLKASTISTSWKNNITITASLYDKSNTLINGSLSSNFNGTHNTTNGRYKFTLKSGGSPGKKTCTVKYAGSSKYEPSSKSISINFTKDTPTLKAISSTSLYKGYYAKYKLLDSKGNPITNTNVQIRIGNGSYKNYKTDSNGIASVKITESETVYYKFETTSLYNGITYKSQKFTIKANPKIQQCVGKMSQSPATQQKPYQTWSDLYTDCTTGNYLRCGHESTGYSNKYTLGSKSGTYDTPAKLYKSDWDLNVPKGATIKSVHVIWSEKQTNGPSASTSKTSFINIKKVTLKVSGAISYNKEINTNSGGATNGGKWVEHNLNLGTDFDPSKKVKLELIYGQNDSPNTGTIYLKGPQMIVEYIPKQT